MKQFDFNSVESLSKLRESLNTIIDNRIHSLELNEAIESFSVLPFACLNDLFDNVSCKLYESNDGKSLIRKYVKTIKESSELKNTYRLYDVFNEAKGIENPTLFLQETISMASTINKKSLHEKVLEVAEIVKECVRCANLSIDEINSILGKYKGSIKESIEYIVSNNKEIGNIVEYSNNMSKVVTYLNENCTSTEKSTTIDEGIDLTNFNDNELLNELNKVLSISNKEMELWENKVVNDIAFSELTGKSKEELFEEYKNSCIDVLNERLNESNIENSSELILIKEKLTAKSFNVETINEDLLKLSELKETLLK